MTTDLLEFWFGSASLAAVPSPDAMQRWFGGGPTFDAEIARRFGPLLDTPDVVAAWATDPAGALAAVLVLDQLPRNVFRGASRAFATDAAALGLAEAAIAARHDRALGVAQRVFLYLPYQHAEDAARQDDAVGLYAGLAGDARGTPGEAFAASVLTYAEQHRAIVRRFGRFPGRNLALGRADTPEEAAWLAAGGETFGQRR